ncbi:hypothetical protein PSEUDO8BK_40305 [Pseudomonas sp. 8BK]|nr:hypothetical protein PSEUDO8BK_40305 [Pseudomonas sp. 8BK]
MRLSGNDKQSCQGFQAADLQLMSNGHWLYQVSVMLAIVHLFLSDKSRVTFSSEGTHVEVHCCDRCTRRYVCSRVLWRMDGPPLLEVQVSAQV